MKIAFCGGGTAGHVHPALAVAVEMRKRGHDVFFIARAGGQEYDAVKEENIRTEEIRMEGFSRSLSPKNIRRLYVFLRAKREAKRLLKEEKPDALFATGGYVCFPAVTEAAKLRIPVYLHESNAIPGLAVRLLAKKARTVFLGFSESGENLSGAKTETVGNPLRAGFTISRSEARKKLALGENDFFILSFGGSLGSAALNEAILSMMEKEERGIRHLHAVGTRYATEEKERHPSLFSKTGERQAVDYIRDMPTCLSAADLVIARAGAMTVAEIAACRVPSILIPSPNVTKDHQTKNALALQQAGGAILLPECELCEAKLIECVNRLKTSAKLRLQMKNALGRRKDEKAATKIADAIQNDISAAFYS